MGWGAEWGNGRRIGEKGVGEVREGWGGGGAK